jgi:hypothetical protein
MADPATLAAIERVGAKVDALHETVTGVHVMAARTDERTLGMKSDCKRHGNQLGQLFKRVVSLEAGPKRVWAGAAGISTGTAGIIYGIIRAIEWVVK